MVGVSGVSSTSAGVSFSNERAAGATVRERLDVGRVAAGRAHEGVFADRGGVQELLAARTAHGAGVRLHDHVLEAEAL